MITLNQEIQLSKVLMAPVFTEKASAVESAGQYVFKVRVDANKHDIKQAIEHFFGVQVLKVRTAIVKGKVKRARHGLGQTKNHKRAIVQLAEGQTLTFAQEGA
jgi:large subunit ribosomal protein L23